MISETIKQFNEIDFDNDFSAFDFDEIETDNNMYGIDDFDEENERGY